MSELWLPILLGITLAAGIALLLWYAFRIGYRNAWERDLRKRGFGDGWEQEMKKRLREMREWRKEGWKP